MKFLNFKNLKNESGLTLIELIVAVGIFGLVIGMVFGVFTVTVTGQHRIIALRNVEDNLRFVAESMAREARTGKDFTSDSVSLSFTNDRNQSVIYRLNNGIVEKSSDGGLTYLPITGPEITVDYLNFSLAGQAANDGLQPRITVAIGAESRVGNQKAGLKIQTTISARQLQS